MNTIPMPTLKKITGWIYRSHQSCALSYEDLLQEAVVAYLELPQNEFDPERGTQYSTWMIGKIRFHLLNVLTKSREKSWYEVQSDADEWNMIENMHAYFEEPLFELLELLSPLGQEICSIILQEPNKYITAPKNARGILYRTLRQKGWKWEKIWSSFQEIKKVLNENLVSQII